MKTRHLLVLAVSFVIALGTLGCSGGNSKVQAAPSPTYTAEQLDKFLAAVEKLPPAQRNGFVEARPQFKDAMDKYPDKANKLQALIAEGAEQK